MPALLAPSDELHCPHCRHWHPVIVQHTEGTEYTRQMLYWECGGQQYYAGQAGTQSRHQTRRPGTGQPINAERV